MRAFLEALRAPWPARRATAFTILFGVALLVVLDRSASMRSTTWHVDEGQRISESYFFRLLEEGAFERPEWFRVNTDSSHPQLNKFYFGLALRVHGVEPPRDLALPRYFESGGMTETGWQPPPHLLPLYEPMLRPARRASLLCNVISWMVISWLLLRWCGGGAALLAAAIITRQFLPLTFFATARSDALQTCAFTLTLLPLAAIWRAPRSRMAWVFAILAGLFAAISFQTRLNGLLALGGVGVVLLVLAARSRNLRPLLLLCVATFSCFATALISNPYYWAKPSPAPGLAAVYLVDEPLPLRVVHRFEQQVADLQELLIPAQPRLRSPLDRFRYVSSVIFSGKAGLLLLAGMVAATLLSFVRRSREMLMMPALWSLPVILVFSLWLPVGWEAYVMLIFPSAVFFSAMGWHALLLLAQSRVSHETRDTRA